MDVITFGEAMVRLAPAQFRRLEQAYALDLEIGGAELNTAVGLARLGRRSSWVSRLTDNPLGRLIANRVRETGVQVDDLLFTDQDRVGLYFLEFGAAPRASGILYDRADSAASKMASGQFDWRRILQGARWFYITGITAALSPTTAAAALEVLKIARELGVRTCLDPNYRAKLWTVEAARNWLQQAIQYVDVLVTNPEDIQRFFGIAGTGIEEGAAAAVQQYQLQAIALTLRETPSVWKNSIRAIGYSEGKYLQSASYDVEIVDRLGAGDAFVSGLLHGLLDGDLQKGLDFGAAMSALKHSIPGDLPWITKAEVDGLLQGSGLRINR